MNTNNTQNSSLDFFELILFLWQKKFTILLISIIFGIAASIWSLSLTDKYSSSVLIVINENNPSKSSGSNNQIDGGIASIIGGSISGESLDQKSYAIEIIKSRIFIKSISNIPDVFDSVMASNGYSKNSKKVLYNDSLYDANQKKWKINKPSNEDFYNKFLQNLRISREPAGFIQITYTHHSPIFAKSILDIIIEELNDKVKEEDLNNAERSLDYLIKQLDKTQQKDLRESINNLIEENMKIKMLANIDEYYLIKPVDPPYIPEFKSYPARTLMVLLSIISGFILTSLSLITHKFIIKKY